MDIYIHRHGCIDLTNNCERLLNVITYINVVGQEISVQVNTTVLSNDVTLTERKCKLNCSVQLTLPPPLHHLFNERTERSKWRKIDVGSISAVLNCYDK